MNTIAAAYALDWIIGDPEWLPHPVRLIGAWTEAGEKILRRRDDDFYDLLSGSLLTLAITVGSGLFARNAIKRAKRSNKWFGSAFEIALASSCLATRNLLDEAQAILAALDAEDLSTARRKLARIVGRDTDALSESEICRATIETLAESLSDGIIAPLFYLSIGGAPLAIAYKAVNTLDSMIGHKDEGYFYFGKFAARLDDCANYLPARLAALLICSAALISEPQSFRPAFSAWLKDGSKHDSPNAGQPESAMAGALQARLGGTNTYRGEAKHSPLLGECFDPPSTSSVRKALKRTTLASLLGVGLFFVITKTREKRRAKK
jgi:adenosylcobinamide-phosphate synthase